MRKLLSAMPWATAGRPDCPTVNSARPIHNAPPLERQREPRIVESAVHAELSDAPAVDEATEAHVRRFDLLIGIRVEDVAAPDGEPDPAGQLVRKIEVRQRLGAEVLVVRRVGRVVILDRSVICRPPENAEPTALTAR